MAIRAASRDGLAAGSQSLNGSLDPIPEDKQMLQEDSIAQEKTSQPKKKSKKSAKRDGDDFQHSLQDRLLATIIAQVVPANHAPKDKTIPSLKIGRKPKELPEFSVRLMAHNFRRFNARIGFFIPLQKNVMHVLSWQQPTATLSFLAIHTLICLEPRLLPALPFAGIIFGIMIPSFLALHPTPSGDAEVDSSLYKQPQAPPAELEPAPEFSVEFWRNLAALQNGMGEFAELYDTVNDDLLALVNFTDEGLASALFPVMLALAFASTFGVSLLSWQISALVGGWLLVLGAHPATKKLLKSLSDIQRLRQRLQTLQARLRGWSATAVVMQQQQQQQQQQHDGAGAAEAVRQVEIFELQRHHAASDTWEPWLFSPAPYEPLSPARIDGERPRGTQFFADVQAPAGWAWRDAKWRLDLFAREWVEQRMVTGVEIETEGERWVYDMPPLDDEGGELLQLQQPHSATPSKERWRRRSSVAKSGWEETAALEQRGEWRRRRWTRLVERKAPSKKSEEREPE